MDNLRKEARSLPPTLDNMIYKETIEAQARGVEQILRTPEAFIKDLTNTIDRLTEELEENDE